MFNYSIDSYLLYDLAYFFIVYAFIGWILETVYASLEEGRFINRGFLNGPFCPIYGFGAVILILALHPIINNIYLLFIGAVILTTSLEYLTGWVLEKTFGHKWWDYSQRRFNLQGRICLRFSVYWGIIAVVMLKLLHPEVVKAVDQIPLWLGLAGLFGLSLYFVIDFFYTLRQVIEIKAVLTEIKHLTIEARERLEFIRESSLESIEETREELRIRYEPLVKQMAAGNQRLLDAFPNLRNKHHDHLITELKDSARYFLEMFK